MTHLELIETTTDGLQTGILWLNVQETELLRRLHERANQELTARFGNVTAAFGGEEHHFHLTDHHAHGIGSSIYGSNR